MPSVVMLLIPWCVYAQEERAQEERPPAQNQIGINVLHTPIVYLVSVSIADDVSYVPIHLCYVRSLSKNLGVSVLGFYRRDQDADFRTNEFGFAVGPRLSFHHLKGWFIECKVGLGIASGVDYFNNDYSRWDFVVQPDVGYTLMIGSNFSVTGGIGLQTLVELSETPSRGGTWDWNDTGRLSHYYLPVANLSLALTF
jgi:hypothetical protein